MEDNKCYSDHIDQFLRTLILISPVTRGMHDYFCYVYDFNMLLQKFKFYTSF